MLTLSLLFPSKVRDWINPIEPSLTPETAVRNYRLEKEEILQDGITKLYTYVEVQ